MRGAEVNVIVLAVRPRGKGLLPPHRPRIVDLEAHPYLAALLAAVGVIEHVVGDVRPRLRQVAAAVLLRLRAGPQDRRCRRRSAGRRRDWPASRPADQPARSVGVAPAQQQPARRIIAPSAPAAAGVKGTPQHVIGSIGSPANDSATAGCQCGALACVPAVDVTLQINRCVSEPSGTPFRRAGSVLTLATAPPRLRRAGKPAARTHSPGHRRPTSRSRGRGHYSAANAPPVPSIPLTSPPRSTLQGREKDRPPRTGDLCVTRHSRESGNPGPPPKPSLRRKPQSRAVESSLVGRPGAAGWCGQAP